MNPPLNLVHIDTALIDPHPWNRKEFDRASLDELKADVLQNGIETPLSLREKEGGRLEIIKGERRWTVAMELEMPQVPAFVAAKNDLDAYLSLLRDNLQREQLSPVQEAAGYHRLMGMTAGDGAAFTPEKIAQSLSRSVDVVYRRLKLVHLPAKAREALDEGRIAEEVAFQIGRLPTEGMRDELTKAVLSPPWGQPGDVLGRQATRDMVRERFMVSLKGCPWDKADAALVPVSEDAERVRVMGGACVDCPMLAKNDPLFAGELGSVKESGTGGRKSGRQAGLDPLTCLNPQCYQAKIHAHAKRAVAHAAKEGREVISPKEAAKLFDEHRGELRHDTKLERLSDKPGHEETGHWYNDKNPTYGAILKLAEKQGIKVPVKVTINPTTKELVELVDRKTMIEVARKVKPEIFKKGEQRRGEGGKGNDAEAKARKADAEKQKLEAAKAVCGMTMLRVAMGERGIGQEERRMILELALEQAGADGIKWMSVWLKLDKIPKAASGRDYLKPILKRLEGESMPQLEILTAIALMSQSMRWQQCGSEAFKMFAKHFAVDMQAVTAAAKFSLEKPEKKGKVEKPPMKSRSKAVRRNEAADAANGIRTAADGPTESTEGTEGEGLRSTDDYCCDACGAALEHPIGKGILFAQTPKGQLLCQEHGGKWEKHRDICARQGSEVVWPDKPCPLGDDYECDGCRRVIGVPVSALGEVDAMKTGEFMCTHCGGTWVPYDDEAQPRGIMEAIRARS